MTALNTKARAQEIFALLGEAEHWRGQCDFRSPEAESLDKVIEALKATVRLIVDCSYASGPGDR